MKNTGTILEKLRRQGGWTLGGMQDLAGMRVVGDFDLDGQDVVVGQLRDLFANEARPPKVIDRRAEPMHGYRAVHVIVFPDGQPLEIQVRTSLQHEWAELFEKLADRIGRGIRYGEPPTRWLTDEQVEQLNEQAREVFDLGYALRENVLAQALTLAQLIDLVEQGTAQWPGDAELAHFHERAGAHLEDIRLQLKWLDE